MANSIAEKQYPVTGCYYPIETSSMLIE